MSVCVSVCMCAHMCVCDQLTDGDVRGAVGLQEGVEVLPGLGDPVDDLDEVVAASVPVNLRLDQLPPQETAQEAFHRLSVVGTQHPPGGHTGD